MRITVSGAAPVDARPLLAAIRRALRPFKLPRDASLSVAFVSDARMRELNGRYRGKARTTDVLSFGQPLPARAKGAAAVPLLARDPDGTLDLGDVLISADQAARQARRRGHALDREVAFLAAHGALHLLGFEDETRSGYREMVSLGEEALGTAPARSLRGGKARA